MTGKRLDEIKARPASDEYVEHIAKTVLDMEAHDHASVHGMGDIYCANLAAYMGERIAPILVRLREAEASLCELRASSPDSPKKT